MSELYKSTERVDLKASSDAEMSFEGYLSVFQNVDSYGDVVEPGAFAKSIKRAKDSGTGVPILENHGGWKMTSTDSTPVGFFSDLEEDEIGLKVKGVLAPTARGKDLYALLKTAPKGFMGMSIGYHIIKARNATQEEYQKSGVKQFLEEVELVEGSIVTFPANTSARVENVKSFGVYDIRSIERALKTAGFTGSDAKKAVSVIKQVVSAEEKTEPDDTTFVSQAFDEMASRVEAELKVQQKLHEMELKLKNSWSA